MAKQVNHKQIYEKLEEIEKKIARSLRFGKLDTIFVVGLTLVIAGLTLTTVEGFKDTFVPLLFEIVGFIFMFGSNIWRKRI